MKSSDFEKLIIKALYTNEAVRNKVLPSLKSDWFFDIDNKFIIEKIIDFNGKYGKMPNVLETRQLLDDETTLKIFEESIALKDEEVESEYLLGEIEEFVRKKLLYNSAADISQYVSGTKQNKGSFADQVSDAETFSFDTNIGFSFFDDPKRLYEDANTHEKIYNTGLQTFNDMIGGGFHEKSLNLIMASTNIGKTLIMCSLATNLIINGHNVLYVTFEDPENKIASRIAQNMFDITQAQYKHMTLQDFGKAFTKAKQSLKGNRLIIKEYPECSTNALMLKSLIKELDEKQGFKPDILFIDYIGCMIPNGRPNPNLNTNTTLMLIASQIRAVGMELGIPVISAAQTNRGGYGTAEISLNDAADSFSSTMKADAIFGITQPDEFKEQGMYLVKLLKTRYGNQRGENVTIGVDIDKQRIFDINSNQYANRTINIFDSGNNNTPEPKPQAQKQEEIDDEPYVYDGNDDFTL